jgi:hypothetical protein
MTNKTLVCVGMGVLLAATTNLAAQQVNGPAWESTRRFRILVEVKPSDLGSRARDERPAAVSLDLGQILSRAGVSETADLSTLQVMRYDPSTGKPIPYNNNIYAEIPYDLPLQWYDAAIPDPFPDRDWGDTVPWVRHPTDPKPDHYSASANPWVSRPYWGYYYEVIGDWKKGRLAWTHIQEGHKPSYYAVYFDTLKKGEKQSAPPPRGWLGDGAHRTAKVGRHSTGLYHVYCGMIDFNQDKLLDIVCGSSRGGIVWYENLGTAQKPRFTVARLLFQSDGKPIDPGFLSTPTVTDWDRDGKLDLLVGADGGFVYFYRNVGTNAAPRYEEKGPLKADERTLRMPVEPVPEVQGPHGEAIYKEDYEPFVEVVDWDGDGDDDLLIGGYVTGRIFWYENTGRGEVGLPILTFRNYLLADGKPLDVGWSASPTVADIDADGDLDLIAGVWRKWGNELPPEVVEDFLAYYENIGTRTKPVLTMKPLPRIGNFPSESVPSPTLADWDGDGDLDLLVSAPSGHLYFFENVGDRKNPKFDARSHTPLPIKWGNDPLPGSTYVDWNHDGWTDIISADQVFINAGHGLPWNFKRPTSVLPPDQVIDHRSWQGDDWAVYAFVDFDQDGETDILFGDFRGQVWFHKNLTQENAVSFDTKGVLVTRADGTPVRVGPSADSAWDFTVLQGSRIELVAEDFDGDGSIDLHLSDTYGRHYFCKRGKHGKEPVVESQMLIAELPSRSHDTIADWDGDGKKDLLVSTGPQYFLLRNTGDSTSGNPFAQPERLNLPFIPVMGDEVVMGMLDLNRDGDQDLIFSSAHGGDCFFERSYLNHGYAEGAVLAFEKKQVP